MSRYSGGMAKSNSKPDYAAAHRHLSRRDAVLKRLIRTHGPCTLRHDPDGFSVLCRSIVAQQISSKAAIAISTRLLASLPRKRLTPRAVAEAADETMRAAGLSANKQRALRDLADKALSGEVPFKKLADLPDEDVIAKLLPVYGIGRWTAEMFLIFSLGRHDVLPIGDLGLRVGVQRQYELPEIPEKNDLIARAEPWRPYRSIATWYFWRSFGNVPQSH